MVEKATDPRDQVIDAADALFYARGIRAVGMDDVRSSAGVSLKRLYALFAGKEGLVLAVLRKRHAMWSDGPTAVVDAVEDPVAAYAPVQPARDAAGRSGRLCAPSVGGVTHVAQLLVARVCRCAANAIDAVSWASLKGWLCKPSWPRQMSWLVSRSPGLRFAGHQHRWMSSAA